MTARSKHMTTFALTEHIPRGDDDLYPEELAAGFNAEKLSTEFDAYVAEAHTLRHEVEDSQEVPMQILVGFEAEWISAKDSAARVRDVLEKHDFDYFIGSVHHVRTIPVDFDRTCYERARDACGGSDEALFGDYYDSQLEMLQSLKPTIVGHFDLIRLLSDHPDANWKTIDRGEIWFKIMRNLRYVVDYGGLLELNSAALRKGLEEPYPRSEICTAFMELGGSFVMSDDSHGVDQIGTNYERLFQFMNRIGLKKVEFLEKKDGGLRTSSIQLADLESHAFWKR